MMTAPIIGHYSRDVHNPEMVNDAMAGRVRQTIRRQHAEALPKVEGQLWTRLAEVQLTRCACARHRDGSTTNMLCPMHADYDPCLSQAMVTGKRRKGSIRAGKCSNCGWTVR